MHTKTVDLHGTKQVDNYVEMQGTGETLANFKGIPKSQIEL